MKTINYSLLAISLLLTGCASTAIFGPDGKPLVKIQGDATNVTYRGRGVSFHADLLFHSPATIAGGQAVHQDLQGAATFVTSVGSAAALQTVAPGSVPK